MAVNEQITSEVENNLTEDQKHIINYVQNCLKEKTNCNMIILGSAGTGKSFLLNYIEKILTNKKRNVLISSYQSIAASNINGITLYKLFSFFGNRSTTRINFTDNTCIMLKKNKKNKYKKENVFYTPCYDSKKIFSNTNYKNWLLIDEISNISLELLDDINSVLQTAFESKEIFGGVNIIFFGDFHQLKPVEENPIYNIREKNHFIKNFVLFELTTNLRQKNKDFFQLCECIKKSILTSDQKKKLHSRLISNLSEEEKKDINKITYIFPTKKKCEDYNNFHLKNLNKPIYEINAVDKYYEKITLSEKEKLNFQGLNQKILIAEESKVMITTNFTLYKQLYSNGEFCFITKIIKNDEKKTKYDVYVKFDNKDEILLPEIERSIEITKKDNIKIIAFMRTMLPIQLSWAVTTHKIQGITLKEAVIDLSYNNFDPVQLYVSISRVQNFDKLYITDLKLPLNKSKDRKIVESFIKELKKNKK